LRPLAVFGGLGMAGGKGAPALEFPR
jgi:hypothetical protein